MMRRRAAAWAAALVGTLAMPCAGSRWQVDRARPALPVEYAGCATVLAGPVCVPGPARELSVWVPGDVAGPLDVSGARVLGPALAVQAGRRLRLKLAPRAERLSIGSQEGRFELALGHESPPAWSAEVRELLRAQRVEEALARLTQSLSRGPADERGRVLAALARGELRRGQASVAGDLLRRALVEHRLHGRLLDLVDDTTVLVFTLLFQARRFDEARDLLSALPAGTRAGAEGAYYLDYYGGLLALVTGDVRTALHALGEAARRAERLGLSRLQRAAEQVLAEPLQQLGRRHEAEALLERLWREAPADLPPCERAQLLNAAGWNRLLIRELGDQGPDPLPALEAARTLLNGACAQLPDERSNVELNLVLASLQRGEVAAAHAALATVSMPARPPLHVVLWQREIEARLALAEGRSRRALERYTQLEHLAEASLAWGARWRAAEGRARALQALGEPRAALAAYAEAEQRLDDDIRHVPVQEGRESYLAGHERATRAHLALLLEQGDSEAAWALVHRAHTRIVTAFERGERLAHLTPGARRAWELALSEYRARRDALSAAAGEDWRLPADRLRALGAQRLATQRTLDALLDRAFSALEGGRLPRPAAARAPRAGEALLAFHPLPRGNAALLVDAQGVAVRRVDCQSMGPTPDRLGDCLLAPLAARLRAARHVTLLPYGPLAAVDLHALRLDGVPLLAQRSVSWSLALEARAVVAAPARPVALLVGDARGDLPAARAELAVVAVALGRTGPGWRIERVEGEQATYGQVQARLAHADLFHFAGHGHFGGRAGWESALPLARDAILALGDVLALERAPSLVVLAGCETGRASHESAQALGLAQAFVSRGAQAVLATTRAVDDRSTALLIERFYAHWTAGQTPAEALRQAQLALLRADGHADWAAFRLFEP